MAATAPHYALEQAQDAAHGGEGWRSRQGTTADELGSIWAACGVSSECGTLRSVLTHRPGAEIEGVADPASALWHDLPDPHGMAFNMVPLAPGVVVMPAGNPVTRAALEANGVTCLEAEVDELMKGAGSVHCMTGVIHREAA